MGKKTKARKLVTGERVVDHPKGASLAPTTSPTPVMSEVEADIGEKLDAAMMKGEVMTGDEHLAKLLAEEAEMDGIDQEAEERRKEWAGDEEEAMVEEEHARPSLPSEQGSYLNPNMKICPNCGTPNEKNRFTCFNCRFSFYSGGKKSPETKTRERREMEKTKPKVGRATCPCCDQPTAKGSFFIQGHDARVKSRLSKVSAGKMTKKELTKAEAKIYDKWMESGKTRAIREIAAEIA